MPAACGGGQENPSARRQKISSPETPPFFARSLLKFKITKNYFHFFVLGTHFCRFLNC